MKHHTPFAIALFLFAGCTGPDAADPPTLIEQAHQSPLMLQRVSALEAVGWTIAPWSAARVETDSAPNPVAESAVVLKGLDMASLRRRFDGRNDARERRIVSAIVPQSQSVIECLARFLLRRAGFHVESQVNVPGMGHLDLMVDGRLGIETDGAGFHMDKASFEEDRRRWNVTTRRGIPTLIVSYQLLRDHPEEFITLVRETLSRLSAAA